MEENSDFNFENFLDGIEGEGPTQEPTPEGSDVDDGSIDLDSGSPLPDYEETQYRYLLSKKHAGMFKEERIERKYELKEVPVVTGPMNSGHVLLDGMSKYRDLRHAISIASIYNRIPEEERISVEEAMEFMDRTDFRTVEGVYEYNGDIPEFYKKLEEKYENNYFFYLDKNLIVPDKMLTEANFMDFINSLPEEVRNKITKHNISGKMAIRKKNIVGLYNNIIQSSSRYYDMRVNPIETYIEYSYIMVSILMSYFGDRDILKQVLRIYHKHFAARASKIDRITGDNCEDMSLPDLRYFAHTKGIQNVNMLNREQICSRIFSKKLSNERMKKIRDKLRLFVSSKWDYELLCDVFEGLDMEELRSIAELYDIKSTTRATICEDLGFILETKKKQYAVASCTNTMDPISGTDVVDIDPRDVITITQGDNTFCFEIEGIHEYIQRGNTKNPYTNVPMNYDTIDYINSEYTKYSRIKGSRFDSDKYRTDSSLRAWVNQMVSYIPYFGGRQDDFINADYYQISRFVDKLEINGYKMRVPVPRNTSGVPLEQYKIKIIRSIIKQTLRRNTPHTVKQAWGEIWGFNRI